MDEESNNNNSPPKIELRLFNSISNDVMLNTGHWIDVHEVAMCPLIDCHMHIQSLHATPLPVQWGTTYLRAGALGKMYGQSRREITVTAAGGNLIGRIASIVAKDIGKVGRLSTDLIAKLYMSDIKNGDFKQTLEWTLSRREVRRASRHERAPDDRPVETEPIMPDLEALSVERERLLQDFYRAAAYYYSDTQVFYLSFVMPMDLSYAHFWGAHGLPINLPVPGENTFYYIDDLHHIRGSSNSQSSTHSAGIERRYEPYNNPYEPNITNNQISHHLSYCFDFQKELENYLNYMGYREGLTGYTAPSRENAFYIVFDHDKLVEELTRQESTDGKKSVLDSHKERFVNDELTYSAKAEQRRAKYMHYLQEIPGDNIELFEDYYLQLAYTEASAYRYPLQLIPFYHYDPRRYYTDSSALDGFAAEIEKRHGYYRLNSKRCSLSGALPELRKRVEFTPFKLEGVENNYYKEMFADRYAIRNRGDHNEPVKIGSGSMKENSYVIDRLFPKGCFMGVKLYPALGYPPDLYNRTTHGHEEGDYCDEQFSGLNELYVYCEENKIPVLAHCCSLGMSIADGYNYEIRDDRKAQGDSWEPRREHSAKGSAIHMDDIGGHPRNWEPVLDSFPQLKLCLAHFGGQEVWDKTKRREERKKARNEEYAWNIEWRDKMLELINNNENVYTDISYFSLGSRIPDEIDNYIWRSKIAPLEQSYKENLERYYRPGRDHFELVRRPSATDEILIRIALRKADLLGGDIRNIAQNMAGELKNSTRLKERIMMGTDWYMLETSKKGLGPYYAKMFELLATITLELDEAYDAWHQFSVVNPLNFIGFLKSDNAGSPETKSVNGKMAYVLDEERIEKYVRALRNLPKSRLIQCDIKKHELYNFETNVAYKLEQLKKSTIYTAESMTNADGKLIILHGK